MGNLRTHYDNLTVARNAPPDVIKAAFEILSRKYTPANAGVNQESERIIRLITESYETLVDPHKRAQHDAWIQEQERQMVMRAFSAPTPLLSPAPTPAALPLSKTTPSPETTTSAGHAKSHEPSRRDQLPQHTAGGRNRQDSANAVFC